MYCAQGPMPITVGGPPAQDSPLRVPSNENESVNVQLTISSPKMKLQLKGLKFPQLYEWVLIWTETQLSSHISDRRVDAGSNLTGRHSCTCALPAYLSDAALSKEQKQLNQTPITKQINWAVRFSARQGRISGMCWVISIDLKIRVSLYTSGPGA